MPDNCNRMKGYHGTVESRFKSIVENGFRLSKKKNEWLGPGVYFFAEYQNAVWWAKNEANRKSGNTVTEHPFVIEAEIHYKDDEYLDLDLYDDREQFENTVKQLKAQVELRLGKKLRFRSREQKRCYLSKLLFQSTSVRILSCTFSTRYDDQGIPDNKKQHCVAEKDHITILSGKVV